MLKRIVVVLKKGKLEKVFFSYQYPNVSEGRDESFIFNKSINNKTSIFGIK